MKKFITLALVLVLALGLAVPAMAFTSDTSADDDSVPFDLKIYLVEYDDNDLFGMVALPESDRGYAKNEIVAAVVELYVPKNEDPSENYDEFAFGGDNVNLNVTDNDGGDLVWTKSATKDAFTINSDGDKATRDADATGLTDTSNKTYKWLFFAKVTGDDASLYAKLVDGTAGEEFASDSSMITITLDGVDYDITKSFVSGTGGSYTIVDEDNNEIVIYVDEDYKSTGMAINDENLGVNTKGELGYIDNAQVITGKDAEDIMDVYNDVVVDVFGMDYFLIGNYVRDSFFEGLTSVDTIIATVDIEPWTAYVTVPDNIVVDPPKTGDAASIMGFVMVALSSAGVVALRKRG